MPLSFCLDRPGACHVTTDEQQAYAFTSIRNQNIQDALTIESAAPAINRSHIDGGSWWHQRRQRSRTVNQCAPDFLFSPFSTACATSCSDQNCHLSLLPPLSSHRLTVSPSQRLFKMKYSFSFTYNPAGNGATAVQPVGGQPRAWNWPPGHPRHPECAPSTTQWWLPLHAGVCPPHVCPGWTAVRQLSRRRI